MRSACVNGWCGFERFGGALSAGSGSLGGREGSFDLITRSASRMIRAGRSSSFRAISLVLSGERPTELSSARASRWV
jgi:hypothetical protein